MLLKRVIHRLIKIFGLRSSTTLSISGKYFLIILVIILMPNLIFAQAFEELLPSQELKKMSMEELMNLKVTSVSRSPQKLTEVASAIQVITREDIRRSAATNLPEALRLTTNLQVAQLNSYAHIISARGFNTLFSNKLLVMIDGRTVYSPLFAGVFWDAQSVLLEDIERIEVISGPGSTLWGANAVNGVINIITRSAHETQGLYASGAVGTHLRKQGAVRYGGKIGSNFSYRVYAQHADRNNTILPDGQDAADKWRLTQGGFRLDWDLPIANTIMVQGNFYGGTEETIPNSSTLDGQNVLGRWTHTFSEKSELMVQAYFDRTWRRDIPSTISDELKTYDIEVQHRFNVRKRHTILWGGNYRLMKNHTMNSTQFVGFLPNKRDMNIFSLFIQDEIMLIPDEVIFTIGTKLQHNIFTDFEFQPSARLAWIPAVQHTVWGAVSKAVRTPSRIDVDYHIPTTPVAPGDPSVDGGPNFVSEEVIAYELGYRAQPKMNLSLSLAAYYNEYEDLYSVEPLPGTLTYQIQNGTIGQSWGMELSGTWQLMEKWRLRGGYTYFNKDLDNKPGHSFDHSILGYDAQHQFLVQSMINLPGNFQLDNVVRYLSELPDRTPDYFTFDARLAWTYKQWELSFIGQNLWEDRHMEWGSQIPRSFYGKITCRF